MLTITYNVFTSNTDHTASNLHEIQITETSGMLMMKMGNIALRVGMKQTSLALHASAIT